MIAGDTIYTAEFVLKECEAMIAEAIADEAMFLMGDLFQTRKYSQQRFSEWANTYHDDEVITEAINKIRELFEHRINKGGLTGSLVPSMTIFNLKNNYKWRDKPEDTPKGDGMAELFSKLIDKLPN